ncbi:hypothetical protein BC939DRAFT_442360 [Gamsiella multidivaricata]|uniref:uncharacterized protein n=1 Tax=Gamsiella multidivaricata TaxID=101098 RepID=UPI0022210156|nr:uncharacterized protein BC939DRAFT_442360 [Gamsiella multidivaricata]KAI7828950.1 hypothetical protein BC939DRAFT_442360 [Gamsiella multidivaricata]
MSSAVSDAYTAWSTATPFTPPLPVSSHPLLATLTLSVGLFFAAKFGVSQKPSIVADLATTIPSAILLGFGIVFMFLSAGLYL